MAFTSYEKVVMELVIAAYGRVLAQGGLDHYSNLLENSVMSEDEIRDEMMSNTEASIRYPSGLENSAVVSQVFNNILGRTPAQSGIDFYSGRLHDGLSTSSLVKEILNDARSNDGADKMQLDNKLAISEYYLGKTKLNPTANIEQPDLTKIDSTQESLTLLETKIENSLIGTSTGTKISFVSIADGNYSSGGIVTITVDFDHPISVIGTDSTIGIKIGDASKNATYAYSGTSSITYKYVVEDGYASSDVTVGAVENSITLNNTIVRDSVNLNVPLIFDAVSNALAVVNDVTAPSYTLYNAQYDSKTNNFDLYGSGFSTLLEYSENAATDVKSKIDFTKLVWDIDGDDTGTTVSIVSFAESNVTIARVVSDTQIKILFSKDITLESTAGYGHNSGTNIDTIDVASGFLTDTAGNISVSASVEDLILGIDSTIYGNASANVIYGNDNIDIVSGGAGNDRFVFAQNDSIPIFSDTIGIDSITDLSVNGASADTIDLDISVSSVNVSVSGAVSKASFIDDLNTLLHVQNSGFNTTVVGDKSACLASVSSGDLSGKVYLVVDYDANDVFDIGDFIVDVNM